MTNYYYNYPYCYNNPVLKALPPPGVCLSLNVTVSPSPLALVQSGDSINLRCAVTSQRRRGRGGSASLPVVRWNFLPGDHARLNELNELNELTNELLGEVLVARVNMHKARFYGNYSKRFLWDKMRLTTVRQVTLPSLYVPR